MCLREVLGKEHFEITDHWESDSQAMGISKKENSDLLAYISPNEKSKLFYVSLELPHETKVYEQSGEHVDLTYKELLVIIKKHLCL